MGKEIVLFRTQRGEAAAVEAFCPHLGAHFGHGGTVEGECLRCPFHGFQFDTAGTCVTTGYGYDPPKTAQLGTYPIREKMGLLLVFHHPDGLAPDWEIPTYDLSGYTAPRHIAWEFEGHPQETSENSVDLTHLRVVHKYVDVNMVGELHTEGPYLRGDFEFRRKEDVFGSSKQGVQAAYRANVHGLGVSVVQARVPKYGLEFCNFVLPTPLDERTIILRAVGHMKKVKSGKQVHPLAVLAPTPFLNWLMARQAFKGFAHDITQDFDVWKHKAYLPHPALAKGDGPVGRYRTWVRQFYPHARNGQAVEKAPMLAAV